MSSIMNSKRKGRVSLFLLPIRHRMDHTGTYLLMFHLSSQKCRHQDGIHPQNQHPLSNQEFNILLIFSHSSLLITVNIICISKPYLNLPEEAILAKVHLSITATKMAPSIRQSIMAGQLDQSILDISQFKEVDL